MTTSFTGRTGGVDRAASVITELSVPVVPVVAISLLCGLQSATGVSGLAWGALMGIFCGVIPWFTIHIAAHRKHFSDRHVTQRHQRPLAFTICLLAVFGGLMLMLTLNAPTLLIWGLLTMIAGIVVVAGITQLGQKVSMHTFCLAAFCLFATLLTTPWWSLGLVTFVPLVAWSRLRLGHHSLSEAALGAILGVAVTTAAWPVVPV